jgi:hypothetical protein
VASRGLDLVLGEESDSPEGVLHSGAARWMEVDGDGVDQRPRMAPERSVRFTPTAWCSWKSRTGGHEPRGSCQ